jgi:hypothetical protein
MAKVIKEWLEATKEWQKTLKSGKRHKRVAQLTPEYLRVLTARDIKTPGSF